MSCYHPLIGIPTGEMTENGKKKLIIRNAKVSSDPLYEVEKNDGILIPCGRCIGCRLDYSRKWADRMMLELEVQKKGIFITLTYDNDHMTWSQFDDNGFPLYGTLVKRDFQNFMKSFRKELAKDDIRIRFYCAGEYGSKFLRPHYHAIIFGIGLSDIGDLQPHGRNDIGQAYYVSPWIQKIWNNGFVLVSDVSYETCAYVARYVTKKLNGEMKDEYERRNCIPEFSLMSRKPGIGAIYLKENPDCLDMESISVSTPSGGKKIRIPKYFLDQLKGENKPENQIVLPDLEKYDKIIQVKKKLASDNLLIELQKTELPFLEYLEVKEESRKAKIKALKRKG